jgi:hypothetical protein
LNSDEGILKGKINLNRIYLMGDGYGGLLGTKFCIEKGVCKGVINLDGGVLREVY